MEHSAAGAKSAEKYHKLKSRLCIFKNEVRPYPVQSPARTNRKSSLRFHGNDGLLPSSAGERDTVSLDQSGFQFLEAPPRMIGHGDVQNDRFALADEGFLQTNIQLNLSASEQDWAADCSD